MAVYDMIFTACFRVSVMPHIVHQITDENDIDLDDKLKRVKDASQNY